MILIVTEERLECDGQRAFGCNGREIRVRWIKRLSCVVGEIG